MRIQTLSALILMLVFSVAMSSCGMRDSWSGLPDRGGHAYNSDPAAAQAVVREDESAPEATQGPVLQKEVVPVGPIQGGERLHRVASGERLYQIAEAYGVSLYWLIKRNDLGTLPYSGQQLIVPGPVIQ